MRRQEYGEQFMDNRSVPTDTVLLHLIYENVSEAVAWLTKTFGITEHYVTDPRTTPEDKLVTEILVPTV